MTAERTVNSRSAPAPVGSYPHARREGEWLFLSGVGPRQAGTTDIPGVTLNAQGEVVDYDVAVQTQAVIDNVKHVLDAAGASLHQVVDIMVFLTNMKDDFALFNQVYAANFSDIQATRTTIGVVALPTPIAVEFKVIARLVNK